MIRELIQPYDKEVYNPAMQQLQEDCLGEGHEVSAASLRGQTVWCICGKCGGAFIKVKR